RRVMPDRGSGQPQPSQVVEPRDAGLVAADPGIIEYRRRHAQLRRDISGINAAMRTVDDDRSRRFGSNPGDAVGDDHRCKLCYGQITLPIETTGDHAAEAGRRTIFTLSAT